MRFPIFEFNWKAFTSTAIPFGLSMSLIHGWKMAIIEGIAFGLIMTLASAPPRTHERDKDGDLLELTNPRSLAYISATGFWLFLLCLVGSSMSSQETGLFAPGIFLAFAILSLYGFYSAIGQVLIGSATIVHRVRFALWYREKTYRLHDVQSVEVTSYQAVKIAFRNGETLRIHGLNESFSNLAPYAGDDPDPRTEGFYRLKQEILTRVGRLGDLRSYNEKHDFKAVTFSPVGILGFFLPGIVLAAVVASLIWNSRTKALAKIESGDHQALRFADIEKAFSVYKGAEFSRLKQEFESKCISEKNFNCRVASYFREVSKEPGSVELVKVSCSEADPQSCYVLYKDSTSTEDKRIAASVLDHVCQKDQMKSETCCVCYQELKTTRSPSSQ